MGHSAPWANSIEIIALIKPMGLSDPWNDSIEIIDLKTVKIFYR